MTGDESLLIGLTLKHGRYVTYGDNNKEKIIGSEIGVKGSLTVQNVLLVEGLKYNLLRINQLCDKGLEVTFQPEICLISSKDLRETHLVGKRVNNVYVLDLHCINSEINCLITKCDETLLWHRHIAHIHMQHLNRITSKELVIGLPKLKFEKDKVCEACQKGKLTKTSFKQKQFVSTTRPLEMLHMDLFGPSRTISIGGNYYGLVVVDDFSRYTWTLFLVTKDEAFSAFKKLAKTIQNEKNYTFASIKTDHGREFQNENFEMFCEKFGIQHNFSALRTPQQNGVVERKNKALEEIARTLLNETNLPEYFRADAVNTACYVLNRVLIRPILKKTPYELFKERKPNISYFRFFGSKCFILNNGKDNLGKFDSKADEGIFLGYSSQSHAYRAYTKRTMLIKETVYITFDETNQKMQDKPENSADDEEIGRLQKLTETITEQNEEKSAELDTAKRETDLIDHQINLPLEWRVPRNLSLDNIIG